MEKPGIIRTRWAAIGAAVAVSLGAGGIGITHAVTDSGERPIYRPIEPCRLAFTTPGSFQVGPRTAPLGPGEVYTLDGWGSVGECNLPTGTAGLALNVTAVDATTLTNLRFFPAGTGVPNAANLNPSPGQPPTPNAVNVDLNGSGQFSVFNAFGQVGIVIDVVGFYDDHHHDDRYYTEAEIDALPRGYSTLATIPSGQTVTGYRTLDSAIIADNQDHRFDVQLPAMAAESLTDDMVNFAPSSLADDDDAACTGTYAAPTAPAGKVCIYLNDSSRGGVTNFAGHAAFDTGAPLDRTAFRVWWTADGGAGADMYFHVTWAYTAP